MRAGESGGTRDSTCWFRMPTVVMGATTAGFPPFQAPAGRAHFCLLPTLFARQATVRPDLSPPSLGVGHRVE